MLRTVYFAADETVNCGKDIPLKIQTAAPAVTSKQELQPQNPSVMEKTL